jgi:D-alanyl-D-alanine-carboxypeptidase/D-alanyl-D-alanine-endopeptidase
MPASTQRSRDGTGQQSAADDPVLFQEAQLSVPAMFLGSGAPGMVVALVRGDASLVVGEGETSKGNGQEPDGRSFFRIGSIAKAMAGELLADLVVEGKMRLSDPLQRFAPTGKTVPSLNGREITLLDLATHSAGLPREIRPIPEGRSLTFPSREELWDYVCSTPLLWPPATIAAYSNISFQLLGEALAVATGEDYATLLRRRLAEPLGLPDTTLQPTSEQCARLMTGSGLSGPAPCIDMGLMGANAGVYSTGHDMAKWLRYLVNRPSADTPARLMARAVYRQRAEMASAIGLDESGPMSGLGLGWVIEAPRDTKPLVVQKSGAFEGFMSYVAFVPGKGVGIFFVMNRFDLVTYSGTAAIANGILADLAVR